MPPPAPSTLPRLRLPARVPKVLEGPAGAHTYLHFKFQLDSVPATAVSVSYATSNGTATAPSDYRPASGTLTIPAGERSRELWVRVNGDNKVELDETVNLAITAVTGGAILGIHNQAHGVIVNDDSASSG